MKYESNKQLKTLTANCCCRGYERKKEESLRNFHPSRNSKSVNI